MCCTYVSGPQTSLFRYIIVIAIAIIVIIVIALAEL